MRSDPALCFKALCGEEPPRSKKKNKGNLSAMKLDSSKSDGVKGDDSEGSESGEESDGESGPSTPATPSNKR